MESSIVFTPETDSTSKWQPIVGEFTEKYLSELKLDNPAKQRILNEASQILANCAPPTTTAYSEAGLVVGYVQSGKTLSFTSVTALARDNGYGIVIVLTGVTNLLKTQSVSRLVDDLLLERFSDEWRNFTNPGSKSIAANNPDLMAIKERISAWKRFQLNPEKRRPTLIVTVLKHTGHLNNLANLLAHLDIADVPVLIIDDESDQASPNNKSARNLKLGTEDSSSIYAAIENVRSKLSRHTYLQYTATPQANLVAAKSDALSPAFGRVLSSGPDYVGGFDFFGPDKSKLVIIPEEDTINPKHLPEEPPASLTASLRSFWVASAISLAENHRNGDARATRSMMIQVSQQVAPQAVFREWAQQLKTLWMTVLDNPSSASFEETLEEFESEFNALTKTYKTEKSFEDVKTYLFDAMEETKIVEVNSTQEAVKNIVWYESPFWILVGGMKLDRGFTVKGITTTYMPRTVSENAATLQQRARFFGYHRKYFGLCRIFISTPTKEAFETYLEHETELRESLKENEGLPLSEWKRKFILGRALKSPVRRSVIGIRLKNSLLKEGWLAPNFLHENDEAIQKNVALLQAFAHDVRSGLGQETANPTTWKDERAAKKHVLYAGVSMAAVFEFLQKFDVTNIKDVEKVMPALTSLARKMADGKEKVDVVLINDLETDHLEGRKASDEEPISNIFIGRNPVQAKSLSELSYVGDRDIHTARTTLHLRFIKVKDLLANGDGLVPWFALHMEKELALSYLEEVE